jgi:hypothetical protein
LEDFDSLLDFFPAGAAADSRQDSWTGSRLFEVNIWMWRYGRAFPRKISVEDAEEMQHCCRGAETLKRHHLAAAAAGQPAE